jgi:predicted acylesterase/phospholipase RssA
MTTKNDYYNFLKSAKDKRCGVLGSISTLKKNEMATLARRLGYSALDPTKRLYSARNDPTIKENSQIQIERRTPTRTTSRPRRQQQEEKKEETWEEMKERANKMIKEGDKMTEEEQNRAERTGKDTTTSAKFKKAREIKSKGFKLLREANALRRQQAGLPTIEEERKRRAEKARKEKKEKEKLESLRRRLRSKK